MRCLLTVLSSILSIASAMTVVAQPPQDTLSIQLLNKDGLVEYGKGDHFGKLEMQVEVSVKTSQEVRLKPGDFRLMFLDEKLQQLDGVVVVLPKEWENKVFKKGATKEVMTIVVPASLDQGEFEAGQQYYLAMVIQSQIRFLKFKVGPRTLP